MPGHLKPILWCLLGVVVFAAGCSQGSKTRFRVVNAVVDESDLRIVEDGNNVSNNLAYATSTGYLSAHAGSHQIQIEPSGTSNVCLTQTVNFSSGTDTTILPFNFSSSPQSLVLLDDNSRRHRAAQSCGSSMWLLAWVLRMSTLSLPEPTSIQFRQQ